MIFNIVTLFPGFLREPLEMSVLGRASRAGTVEWRLVDPRDFTQDRHRTADDEPFGGGSGMVMKAGPVWRAVESLPERGRVVSLTPRGRPFDHEAAVRLSLEPVVTLLCGRYKGIDERVTESMVNEELSIGDYVLSGGEPAALVVADAVVRLLPGALGDHDSAATDSFYDGGLSAPAYTRPREFQSLEVPEVLTSGHHSAVARWRARESDRATRNRRPDLLDLNAAD
ncbi:MAG: tRNA (guanosine(37)-N1)-methyltransferase TrmD [Gemmatimonadetes bacterium]|nr:tRNA (guanosine(37)-N1)-methyltransferase TrmD [Gemmatimonadota bacterium]